ncbi:MAG: hypothetical protein JXA25_20535 [Anaerolineales bacterium]|nr:hypothetical protein [Anaerolineales bacterium]
MKPPRIFLAAVLLLTAMLACNAPLPEESQQAVDKTGTVSISGAGDPQLTLPIVVSSTPAPPTATPSPTPTNTAEPNPVAGYVILTDIGENDPYRQAVDILAAYRQAEIVLFADSVFETLEELQSLDVRFAAVMVKPERLEEGFAFDVFNLAKQVNPGFDTDFAYGYITAGQPADMVAYVQRVIDYERGSISVEPVFRAFWRTGSGAFGGGEGKRGDMITAEVVTILNGLGYSAERFDMDQYAKPEMMSQLESAGIVYFHAHGYPHMIECGLQCTGDAWMRDDAEQLGNVRFVFACSCYTASVETFYVQGSMDVENYSERATNIDPAESIALGFMRSGSLAYIGHMCMWGRDDFVQLMLNDLADNQALTTGELLKNWYNQPDGPNLVSNSAVPDLNGMDNNRFYYAAVILHGDPAVRIFQETPAE